MIKELFIKCPKCGAVLQVKNSKDEAVKKVSCPNCKQQLAVNFEPIGQEQAAPQPLGSLYYGEMAIPLKEGMEQNTFPGSQYVELNVVRMANGQNKCIVRAKNPDVEVKINGEQLLAEDKVVLAQGDSLEIGHVKLTYNEPGKLSFRAKDDDSSQTDTHESEPPKPLRGTSGPWLYVMITIAAFVLAAVVLRPTAKTKGGEVCVGTPEENSRVQQKNVERKKTNVKTVVQSRKDSKQHREEPKPKKAQPLSDYQLEQKASHGDREAQYELGCRKVNQGGSANVILGINYLKQASLNGSSKATRTYQDCLRTLRYKAAKGDSTASFILLKID